jgi:DNA-binding NarL/FixJ family response regulator
MTIRVALTDDHPMFRFGLRAMLDQSPGISVIGEADDGAGLLALVDQADPDVVLTDLTMGDLDGVTVIRSLSTTHPQLPVIALTMHHDDSHLRAALRAGARGYLLKGADGTAIVRAVHTAASGQTVLDPAVRERLISAYTGDQAIPPLFPDLTTRETDVLRLIARGCGNREIATRLELADKTIRNITSSVLLKLAVPDRTAAALRAKEAGLDTETP